MAYGLKYYKELTQPNGKVVRLEILEKGYEGASKEIGPVCQALRLDIQGDTEIDAPIVKTSLSMTFVDAPDHADARTKKCGNWDEFYTSDATLWRVVLKARNAQETAFATIWGGYITPDSYTEVLQYRGSVTIVARDNIGHLSDFPFDAEGNADGMISLIELIRGAWDKIESPMTLDDQAVANADWMLSDGVYAYDTYMNVSAFEDMNWYDALESALYAYGLVLRYTGNNNVSFYSLRNLPRMGAHEVEDISFIEPTFMSGAERELTPAVKRIEEAVEYKIESAIQPQVKHEDFTLNRDYYAYDYGSASGKLETGIVEAISNTDKTKGWANEADKTLFFDANAYELSEYAMVQPYAETLKKSMYIAVNNVKNASLDNIDRFVTYGKTMRCQDFAYVFNLGMLIQWSGSGKISKVEGYSLSGMTYAVSMERLGITYYYAGEGRWQTSYKELNLELAGSDANNSVEIPIGIGQYGSTDPANFVIYIKRISYTRQGDEASGRGLYVAIQSLEIASPQTSPIFAKNNVNTAYDNTNNVILSRDPKIAPALNTVSLPALIQNGIFIKRGEIYDSAKSWAWDGQTPQQMAVYNHLQLLCYHAKPNNILRGTIVNADVANMQVIWMWHGAEHMLVSGTLDLISGYIENAVLREFARYEDMWGMLDPADMPEVEGKSSTNVEGGVQSSSEGARLTSTTTVNIGGGGSIVLDTFMSDTSQNGVQNRVIKAYVDDIDADIREAYIEAISGLRNEVNGYLNDKADKTTVTALAERVSVNEAAISDNAGNIKKNFDAIGALDKRVTAEEAVTTTYASWWADLKKYIKVEGDNVKISTNLIVTGDTSSGGSGSDTPASGTVTGIKVSASDTLYPNTAGIIDMVSTLASIDVSDQLTAYAKTEDVNAALLTKQDTIYDLATIRSGAALGATALQSITKDMVTAALGYTPLSTSGGTIDGGFGALSIKRNNAYASAIRFENTSGILGYIGINDDYNARVWDKNGNDVGILLHSGNYSSYALPKSGGMIDGTTSSPLKINTSSTTIGIPLSVSNSEKAWLGWSAGQGTYLWNATANKYLGIKEDGTPYFGSNTLIHSGNIGSYAMKWMGNDGYRDLNTFSYDAGVFGSFYSPNAPSGLGAYAVLNLPYSRNAEKPDFMAQILIPNGDDADTNMYYRTSLADSWNPWRKVISTADDGYIYGLGGYIDIQYSDEINRYGGNLYLQHRGNASGVGTGGNTTGNILMCANGGNVGIGTTYPTSKLHIVYDTFPNILLESSSIESSIYFKSLYTGQGWAAGTGVWNQHFGIGLYDGGTSQWILSLRKDCGTDIRGGLQIHRQFYGSFDEGIRVVGASNEYCGIFLGTDSQNYGYTEHQWNLIKTNADTFAIARGLSTNVFFQIYNNGDTYIYRNLIVSGDVASA